MCEDKKIPPYWLLIFLSRIFGVYVQNIFYTKLLGL